ncbi:MAG: type 4a pilus biogenesis protein PilO [Gammaproteobacteria bacterium]|nr:type 4a pilus biogenesis protein PilO [Gammaproteobacteria bacterium]MDH3374179.1 type 4a pilus biogenesis protein PilO [Gammaproteobacteria bacterium]MDH3408920.1 type 4a pilus biogenesis protein PilO [Gammaproteobacteria bacterium]MDH3552817.1 type 4a pilus biogenesis protein PilO [Gammaproteobacteria bacterium]
MQELLRKIDLRQLRLALLGIGAILTTAMLTGVLLPKVKAAHTANREVSVLEEASQDGDELERHLQEQQANIQELRFRLHGDMANLPVRQVEAYIIGRLQRVSWNNNVELVSVEPATGERVQIFQEILFNVQLVGQYRDLYRWLWDARNDLGYLVVKEYGLRRRDNDDDEPLLTADLSLASYRAIQ